MRRAMNRALVLVNVVMVALFAASAALQYNDPDPLRWAMVYGLAAVACIAVWRRPALWWVAGLVGLAALAWCLALAPHALPSFRAADLVRTMKAETPSIEESREILGLGLVVVWMGVLAATGRAALRRRGPRRA
jgi:hypothetical protein